MAIEDIIRSLEQQADAEVKEILDTAKKQAKSIVDDAKVEAEKVKASKLEHAGTVAEARSAQMLNAARLDNKRALAAAKERGIEEVYAKAAQELAKLRADGGYEPLFRELASEALEGVEGDVVVMVDPSDEALAKKVLSEMGVSASIDTSQPIAGGLTVVADGGHVYRRNTLDVRLSKARKLAQSRVAEILFE